MARTFTCNEEIIVVSKGTEDIGKLAMLGNNGQFDPSVIPNTEVTNLSQCAVTMSADLAIPNAAWTNVTWGSEEYDSAQIYNSANPSNFVVPNDGLYLVQAVVCFDVNATGDRYIGIAKNGSYIANQDFPAITQQFHYSFLPIQYVGRFVKGDTLVVSVLQTSGNSLSLLSSPVGGTNPVASGCGKSRFTLTQLSK